MTHSTMFGQIIFSIIFVAVFAKIVKAVVDNLILRHKLRFCPGLNGLPILGTRIKSDPVEFNKQLTSLCMDNFESGIAKMWFGTVPLMMVFRPNTAEVFYKSQHLLSKSFFYRFLNNWLGDGLLMSNGHKWFERRRMLTPAFHFKILEQFLNVFNHQFSTFVRILNEKVDEPEGIDIQPYIFRCMLDNICEAAMGVEIHAQEKSESELIRATYRQTDVLVTRIKYPWLWPDFIYRLSSYGREEKRNLDILHGFSRKVIMDRKAERLNKKAAETNRTQEKQENLDDIYLSKNKPRYAFLDLLLEAAEENESLTDEGIQEEVDTFIFEGHDTTASGAVWITHMLALYPEEQIKVQEEIDTIFGDDIDRGVTNEDIQKLEYTECFIKETFRLFPPVPVFFRKVSEPCVIGGHTIPTEAVVGMFTSVLHRDPENFPDPEKFDPTRWLNDTTVHRHSFCYTPFSAGSRNCIGQRFAALEEKVFLCHLMRNFNLSTKSKLEDIEVSLTMISKPSKPLPIKLTRRK